MLIYFIFSFNSGIACLCVYFSHICVAFIPHPSGDVNNLHNGYLATPEDTSFVQLPLVRLVYSGGFMVKVFFVLSGYVLSIKPLQLIRQENNAALMDNLSSAVFRRAFRLYLPTAAAVLLTHLVLQSGYHGSTTVGVEFVTPKSSLGIALADAWRNIIMLINPFRWDHEQPPFYNHLWTIPIEFRGSLVIFILLLGLAQVKTWVRITVLLLLLSLTYIIRLWEISIFVCGIILAESALISKELAVDISTHLRRFTSCRILNVIPPIFWTAIFVLGLWLGSYPLNFADSTYGYQTIASITPGGYNENELWRVHYWNSCGAILLMIALENYTILQRPFTTVVVQYLGKISFGLYCVHQLMGVTINRWLIHHIMSSFSNFYIGYSSAMIVVTFLTIWAGDLFWARIDSNSVSIAGKLRVWCRN
jgi:peptidoglycan/LPS O-acetylase OafA/YrhL